jgi:hypothetical protein
MTTSSRLLKKSRVSAEVGLLDEGLVGAMGGLPASVAGGGLCQQLGDADQVVGGDCEGKTASALGHPRTLTFASPACALRTIWLTA